MRRCCCWGASHDPGRMPPDFSGASRGVAIVQREPDNDEAEFLVALAAYRAAWNRFDHADPEMIDVAIHDLNAAEARMLAARRRLMERRGMVAHG